MQLMQDLDDGETQILGLELHQDGTLKGLKFNLQDLDGVEMWPGLSWDAHLETWIGWYGTRSWDTIRQLRKGLGGGETHILKPVWVWDDAWMQLRCNLVDLAGGEMLPGCRRDANIRSQIEVIFNWDKEETRIWEPGLRGDTNLETWIGWRWDLDWVEMHILRRG